MDELKKLLKKLEEMPPNKKFDPYFGLPHDSDLSSCGLMDHYDLSYEDAHYIFCLREYTLPTPKKVIKRIKEVLNKKMSMSKWPTMSHPVTVEEMSKLKKFSLFESLFTFIGAGGVGFFACYIYNHGPIGPLYYIFNVATIIILFVAFYIRKERLKLYEIIQSDYVLPTPPFDRS